jgi:peptidyl-prolyl cis-trans isomerase SurA
MKRVSALILLFQLGTCFAANTIIAIVNEDVITLQSIEQQLNDANSFNEKIDIVEQQIEIALQMSKVRELGLSPSQGDINGVLNQLAVDNNISMDQLKSYPQFPSLIQQITDRLSILGLHQYITKDLSIELSEDEINNCTSNINDKDTKQIRIAQIIISEVDNSDLNIYNQEQAIRNFLKKLSDHISKGASFDAFAKLHSQHPSYVNGGLTDWIFVNNPTIEILDLLEDGEVSKIYSTDVGWAIAIKVDERYVDSNLENCKEKIVYQKTQQFYINWLKDLRDSAYIEIYTDKL